MGRDSTQSTRIKPEKIEEYLRSHGHADAKVVSLDPLGQETQAGLKAYGYGRPLLATFEAGGERHTLVVRTMSPDRFGHMRRSQRAEQMILCYDTFHTIPLHIEAQDIGAFSEDGTLVSLPDGDFFLVSNFIEGELYAHDLDEMVQLDVPREKDIQRARALARYLASLHSKKVDPSWYIPHLRDTVGSGEGIFGQCDGYPTGHKIATRKRLREIEVKADHWRWKLRDRSHRACRTHGDFHPFNILFRQGEEFSVLDCSRGGCGEAADDVTCLTVNYVFFALNGRGELVGALRQIWDEFWHTYLDTSGDRGVLDVVPLYFMWRLLVVASPTWYPDLDDAIRDKLLTFGERLLASETFHPSQIDELLS